MVSIVIVTWNSEHEIIPCLHSVVQQSRDNFEYFVVDNNSKDRTVNLIKNLFPGVRIIENKDNLGYAQANNQGIKVARGEYLLLLNPDVVLREDFFHPLIEFINKNPSVGAVAPKLLNPDCTVQRSIRNFPDYPVLLWEVTGLAKLLPNHKIFGKWRMNYFNYEQIQQVEQPMTSCLLVRKAVFDEIGYFDETFPMYYNDVDFCKRLINAGWQIYYLPQSYAIHNRGSSTRKVRSKMIFSMHKSMYHYFAKYDKSKSFQIKKLILYPVLVFTALIRASWGLFVK